MDYEVHNSIGVFRRLSAVSEMLAAADSGMYAGFTAFLRRQVNLIEALQYYVMDMRLNMLYKFLPLSKQQQFHCAGGLEAAPWVVAELAFSIMAGNRSQFILSDVMMAYMEDLLARCCFTSDMRSLFEFKLENEIPTSGHLYDQSCLVLLNNEKRSIVFESLHPPFLSLLKRDIQTEEYLSHNYGVAELMDEFDLLRDTDRDRFVSERIKYLLMELSKCCPYYRDKFNCSLIDLPVMNGLELSNRVPPYGSELISFDDTYAVAFATGGTTGRMKFVYRNDWEDKENARYLAKGLFSQGLKSTDVVFNCLSGGFWGGSHVFLLALSFIGCSVVPLGIEFSNDDCIRYIDQLKPSAILALPSYIMTLAEHVHSTQKTTGEIKGLTKCITGGEMMLPAMKIKISEFLGINQFMSTGYTSNETGAIGFPCRFLPPNHFHIHENMQHVSIQSLDDTTSNERTATETSKTGRIITSNLNRTFMPVLRYNIGDSGRSLVKTLGDVVMCSTTPSGTSCLCGRRLRVFELCGRWDDRVRIGGEDLYLDDVDRAIAAVPELSQIYTLHVQLSIRLFDLLTIHVECPTAVYEAILSDPLYKQLLLDRIRIQFGIHTCLVWSPIEISTPPPIDCETSVTRDMEQYAARMCGKRDHAMSVMDGPPEVVFYAPGNLPRNSRTGKMPKIIDLRK